MKNFISFIMILCFSFSFSQSNRFSAYAVKVAPENEEMVVKLIDDYFTGNKVEGVTVSLYAIMFTAADLNFTHELIFSGEKAAMAKLYSPEFGDTSWQLFSSKLNAFIEENVFSANGWRFYQSSEDVYPFQMVSIISSEDNAELRKWRMMVRDLNEKYPREFRSFATGGISVGGPDSDASVWNVVGYKTYADYLDGWQNNQKFNEENPKFAKEREERNSEVDYTGFELEKKFMRYLVKQW
ncbi:hypothetical protein OA490_01255 [Flavobacteriales bacterium]|nr:hypothetical protein [Flavobacteriales bacterium]